MKKLKPAGRLVVAADFMPTGASFRRAEVCGKVLQLARMLKGTGVCLKVNSALRAAGYDLIEEIRDCGLAVFADLKLFDIGSTLAEDGMLLAEAWPDIVTVACSAGEKAIRALKAQLPGTEVLGVTVLTSHDERCVNEIYRASCEETTFSLASLGEKAHVDGFVCSPRSASTLRAWFPKLTVNTPGIRLSGAPIEGDDQDPARVMTPAQAIAAGATRIIMGRPITQSAYPYDTTMRIIDEIASCVS